MKILKQRHFASGRKEEKGRKDEVRGNGVIEDPAHQDLLFDDGQEGGKQQKRRKSDGSDFGAHAARRIADEAVERLFPPCEQQDAEDERRL